MLIIARLLILAIALYIFLNFFLDNFDDRHNAITYKIYLFIFVFIIQFLFQVFANLINSTKIIIDEIIESSINNALLAVIAFDVYNDLTFSNYFTVYNHHQKILILILLIIGFMTTIKFLQLLINN